MGNYNWENFMQEEFYSALINFFNKLMPPLSGTEEEVCNIVFVSRKAYGLFLLLKEKNLINCKQYTIFSDRYIMKKMDNSSFMGKKIKLVDDTISTGKHFNQVLEEIKKRTGVTEILPYVFMVDREIHVERFSELRNYRIKCGMITDAKEILRFCSIEMLILHQENIPYMVELPYIQERGNEEQYYICLTEEEYAKFKEGNDIWRYFSREELAYEQLGYDQNVVINDVVIRRKHILQENFENFIFNFSIRIQVTKSENNVKLIIIPFVMLKSVEFTELLAFFYKIYDGTEYGLKMKEFQTKNENNFMENSYVAIYRAVVYNLSEYIGREFIEYMVDVLGNDRQFFFGKKNNQYSFEESFIKSNENIQRRNYVEYTLFLLSFSGFKSVRKENRMLTYTRKYNLSHFSYATVSLYFLALIDELRKEELKKDDLRNLNMDEDKSKSEELTNDRFVSIEEYQEIMKVAFPKQSQKELDSLLTICINNMLSQSRIANEIYCDIENQVIYRGFSYGENSESYFDLSAKIYFAAIRTYYNMLCDEYSNDQIQAEYISRYPKFKFRLQNFLQQYKMYGNTITEDEFNIYANMFSMENVKNIQKYIGKREFILSGKEKPYYIGLVEDYIQRADI